MKLTYTTMPKMRKIIRERYKNETGVRRLKAAKWLLENCTDNQLGNVFDRTGAEITALKVRLQKKVDKLAALNVLSAEIEAEGGE